MHTTPSRPPALARWGAGTLALSLCAAGLTGAAGLGLAAPAAAADSGPLADYLFNLKDGTSVPNLATGSGALGEATVKNPVAGNWTGTALNLPGGSKTSTSATWVQLPADVLKDKTSATVTTEVKVDSTMKSNYNFIWNIGNDASNAYFFATAKDAPRSAITVKSNSGESSATSTKNLEAGRWASLTTVLDGDAKTLSFYIDGTKVGSSSTTLTPASITDQSLNTIGRSPWPDPQFKGQVSAFRVYDRALAPAEVAQANLKDAQLNAADLEATAKKIVDGLSLPAASISGDYVALPSASGQVTWESSDPAVIAKDGTVNQPAAGTAAVDVTLTATATVRGLTAKRTTTVSVQPSELSDDERAEQAAARYVIAPVVASGEALPQAPSGLTATVTEATGADYRDGALHATGDEAAQASVTVKLSRTDGGSTTKTFSVKVLPAAQATSLLAYHRTPTSDQEANNADVAYSMHLALPAAGTDADAEAGTDAWEPLNENYGIFFPKTSEEVPAGGTSDSILRSLKDPAVFALEDGGYGVIGTRLARGGASDGTQASSVLIATSPDLRTYTELGLLELDEAGGVNHPSAVYDSASKSYRLSWTTDAGTGRSQSFASLDPAKQTKAKAAASSTSTGASTGRATGSTAVDEAASVPNYAAGSSLTIPTSTAAALQQRFGRISNTGAEEYPEITVEQGSAIDEAALPQSATLNYTDGSTGSLPVSAWDLSGVDTSQAGTYEATGTVKQTKYPTPFSDERADPSVFKYDYNGTTKYLMIATNDLYGANIEQQNKAFMPFRWADTISGLSDEAGATEVQLLKRGDLDAAGNAITGCFWAPEFHVIDGKLSVLFMPCYGSTPNMWSGRASIIQLKQNADGTDMDPSVPANWSKAEHVLRTDGSALNKLAGISLDMTYFEDATGQAYYSWQQLGALFIAKVDPKNPTKLASEPVRILAPEYAWDNTIAEGPNVLTRNGKLYMIYSGSTVGDTYTTGLAIADASGESDLTDPASWSKLNYPIQKSGIFDGAWQLGTGHGMWSEDEDNNLIYVFHARTDHNGLSGRDMFVRRVHFDAEDMPIFDMEPDEELSVASVKQRIVVTPVATETPGGAEGGADGGAEGETSDGGADGSEGSDGSSGSADSDGNGTAGAEGTDGADGSDGSDGSDDSDGANGSADSDGTGGTQEPGTSDSEGSGDADGAAGPTATDDTGEEPSPTASATASPSSVPSETVTPTDASSDSANNGGSSAPAEAAPQSSTPAGGGLAATGAQVAWISGFAGLLLLAGLVLVVRTRSRRAHG